MQANQNDVNHALGEKVAAVFSEVSKVVVGQKEMVEGIFIGLITGGHILLEGVPGLAKTLTISSVAKSLSLGFQRIQFTPDLLPTDLIGTMIFNPKSGEFTAKKGPVFTNIVLADEINRAPAKVQSALLEAMAEKQVTIGDTSYPLDFPFLVMATQNPLEQEGTYPLPEAQMDRFLFKIVVDYPTKKEEMEILDRMSDGVHEVINSVLTKEDVVNLHNAVNATHVDEKIKAYIVDIVMATRELNNYGLGHIDSLVQVGASPRATIGFVRAAKARAFLLKRNFVTTDDVKAVAYSILRHRLVLSFEAEAENVPADDIIKEILNAVEVPSV